ncbi:hypothetical protein D3C81_676170 [compost metagenome]
MFRRADEVRPRAHRLQCHLAQAQALLARVLLDAVGGGAEGIGTDIAQLRERRIRVVLAEVVVVEESAEIRQCIVQPGQRSNRLILGFGFFRRTANDRADAREDLDVTGAAAMGDRRVLHLLGERTGLLQRRRVGEHRIGILAGQRNAIVGRTGLEDHRLPLRRALDVERTFHLEEAALVVEAPELLRRKERAAVAVAHERIVIPRIPQALHHLKVLIGNLVTQCVFGMRAAVVAARTFQRRGHHVPAGTATAEQVQRGELAGHGERIAVRGGERASQTDLLRCRRQCRQQRDRLEAVEEMRDRLLVDVQAVGNEAEGDAVVLGGTRDIDVIAQVDAGIGRVGRMLPGMHVAAGALQHDAERDGTRGRAHGVAPAVRPPPRGERATAVQGTSGVRRGRPPARRG